MTGTVGGNLSNTVMYSPGTTSGLASMTPMTGVQFVLLSVCAMPWVFQVENKKDQQIVSAY